ncbi:hypothetical protein NM688_g9060 [Phlebia brevispora]|uniref:Uncharacterized protein n=1 Tax=Phlebia brevispora TaxID=194682 RepID=A0ACC1RP69_9APHY|nr:hypothetical protein NM688_g9060 [Phlebia brevispora]
MSASYQLPVLPWQGFALAALAFLPSVRADCFLDEFGVQHCSLSNGARIGIAVAIVILALLFIASAMAIRQRRLRSTNYAYYGPSANAQNVNNYAGPPPGNYLPTYSPGYYPGAPQYPPPAHSYDPQSGFAPVRLSSPWGKGLFSRARTFSTPKQPAPDAQFDEFGRITSKGSSKSLKAASTSNKKDKKAKDKSKGKNNGSPATPEPPEYAIPDGSFLPLNLDPQRYEPGDEPSQERRQLQDYGYLSYKRNVVLGLDEVARLVDVVGNELGTRGLTTPFIFSSLALDVSAPAIRRLINAFLRTCGGLRQDEAERMWRDEVKFAGPHELGMCLRWGLARVVRIVGGQEVHGLLSYESYLEWSSVEASTS